MKLTLEPAAKACGISKQALSQAEHRGVLKSCGKNESGHKLYDVEQCQRALQENVSPSQQANGRAQQKQPDGPAPADFFEPPENSKAGVQLARDKVKLRYEQWKLAVVEGKLVDGDKARIWSATRAAAEREALLNWPGRVSAELAGKFGVNEREMFGELKRLMRRHLEERSSTPVNA